LTSQGPKIFIIAGETSGDIHAASLIRHIKKLAPHAQFTGLGGPRMEAEGCRLLANLLQSMDIMWFSKVFTSIGTIFRTKRLATDFFDSDRPDVVVPIDYPGFNLWISKFAHARGIPVVYYISPQIWAWGRGRWKKIKQRIAKVLCIFPFEETLYQSLNIPVQYVGHPLFDHLDHLTLDDSFEASIRTTSDEKIVALLPGTRAQHIQMKLPLMLKAADLIQKSEPNARFIVPCLDPQRRDLILTLAKPFNVEITTVMNRTFELMKCAAAAVTTSGSATLELAHFRTPMVVVYRIRPRDMILAWLFKRTKLIAMPNILAGREVVPEFLLTSDRADLVAGEVLKILEDSNHRRQMKTGLDELMQTIDQPGASERAAGEILKVIEQNKPR
jgi:lipid-A-disaccharide synthase